MNLLDYQKFVKVFYFLCTDKNTQPLPQYRGFDKTKFYDLVGAKTPEEQAFLEEKRTESLRNNVAYGLENAKVFEIDKVEKRLLLMTEAPHNKKIIEEIRLPFPTMFLDLNITAGETEAKVDFEELFGMLITEIKEYNDDVLKFNMSTEHRSRILPETMIKNMYFHVSYGGIKDGTTFIEDCIIPIKLTDMQIKYHDTADVNFIRDFILNLLLFINNPEVEFVEFVRTAKNRERKEREGKLPLPSSNRIRLTGKIKRYVDLLGSNLEGDGFDFKFWVRGHWRHYVNEKFTEMKGKSIWIAPYMKGKGDLRDTVYSIESNKEGKREYKQSGIWFDDIKPADKPLREARK